MVPFGLCVLGSEDTLFISFEETGERVRFGASMLETPKLLATKLLSLLAVCLLREGLTLLRKPILMDSN